MNGWHKNDRQFNYNRFDGFLNERTDAFINPYLQKTQTFADPYYEYFERQTPIPQPFSSVNNRMDFDHNFGHIQSCDNEMTKQFVDQLDKRQDSRQEPKEAVEVNQMNEPQVDGFLQMATQLDGQILSTQEFQNQNNLDLFCDEQLDENSQQNCNAIQGPQEEEEEEVSPLSPVIQKVSFSDNKTNVGNNALKSSRKTYTRVLKVVRVAPTLQDDNMTNETIAAVKGLVMLSDTHRETVIRAKPKKRNISQLCFAERQRIKRERNRIASKKCRQKKLETIERLEQLRDVLMEENQRFETYLKSQRQRLNDVKLSLLKHRLNDCQLEKYRIY